MADIAEQICLAVDQIVEQRLKSIKYDTTITATIVDDKDSKNYKYVCSNGSAQFVAFSKDTTYKKGESVQVTIPNNDYDQQKIIIGKYVAKDSTPFIFVQPFETIIDISNNLIDNNTQTIKGSLLANKDCDKNPIPTDEVLLYSNFFEEGYKDFNRLGLKGQFQSWVQSLKPVSGSYGYRLEIFSSSTAESLKDSIVKDSIIFNWIKLYRDLLMDRNIEYYETVFAATPEDWFNNIVNIVTTKQEYIDSFKKADNENKKTMVWSILYAKLNISNLYLDSAEMYGNPYNFQSYFEQEKVYDISSLGTIYGLSLYFYEKSGTFINELGAQIPYKLSSGGLRNNNLFTKDPYICLGYDLSSFDKEQAIIYSLDGDTFLIEDNIEKEKNKKTVQLRWLHQFDDGSIKVISETSQLDKDYEIRWYRFKMGSPSADQYSGVYWRNERLNELQTFENNLKQYETWKEDLISENKKLINKLAEEMNLLYPNLFTEIDGIYILDETKKSSVQKQLEYNSKKSFSYSFLPEVNITSEQIKVIILFDGEVIRSNIVTFTNEKETASGATAEILAGLSVWCADNSYGNYCLYGQNNNLLNESKANEILKLEARFAENSLLASEYNIDETAPLLQEATEITWEFPLNNSMIVVDGFNYSYQFNKDDNEVITVDGKDVINYEQVYENDEANNGARYKLAGYYGDAIIKVKGNIIYLTRKGNANNQIVATQDYRIEKTYSASKINNTIKCFIKKNSMIYSASKELTFGIMGTNGTDATVVIDFNNNKTALTATLDIDENKQLIGESLKVTARLYDSAHKELDFNNSDLGLRCKWEWAYYYEGHIDYNSNSNQPVDQITTLLDAYKKDHKEATEKEILEYLNSIAKVQLITQELDTSISASNICHLNHSDHLHIAMTTEGQDIFFLILKATITGYGDYDLISYKAIPIRKNKTFRNYIGPTEIIYSTSGYANYYKQPLQLWSCDPEDVNEFDFVSDHTKVTISHSNWNIYNPYGEKAAYVGEINDKNILEPVTVYVKSTKPYGAICYSNLLNTHDPVWIQPLVILQNEYPSATVNRWDGKSIQLGTEKDPSTILTPSLAAGSKDSEGRFSGVMIGDWKGSDTEFGLTEQTGVYGFHQGKISYAFKEDGTGFIGKSGHGRIIFKGDSGVIKSESWRDGENETGMYLDLDDGILKLQKEPGYDQVFLTAKDYRPNYYFILQQTAFAVPVGKEYGQDFEADGKDFTITADTQYYKEGMVVVSNMSAASFAVRVAAGTLYIKEPLKYKPCQDGDKYSERTIYYAYNYIPTNTDNIINWATDYKNYYIKDDNNEYVEATDKKDNNATYYIKNIVYVEAVIKNNINWETEYKNYFIKNEKEEYIPATSTKDENATYYTQIVTFIPVAVFDWAENYTNFYVKNEDGTYSQATTPKQKDIQYYTKSLSKIIVSKEDFESNETNYWVKEPDTYKKIEIALEENKTLEDYYDSTVTYYEKGYEALNYGTINGLETRPEDWNKETDPLIQSGKFYYVLIEKYERCTDLAFDTTKIYYEDNTGLTARYITLSAATTRFPLAIGNHSNEASRKFRVDWDGTCYIQDGVFSGDIDAETGYLGDLILRGGLTLNYYGYIAANKNSLNDFNTTGFWLDKDGLNIGSLTNYFYASTDFTAFYNKGGGTKITGTGIDIFADLTNDDAYSKFAGGDEGLIHMGWANGVEYGYPYIRFGNGTQSAETGHWREDAGIVKKFGGGMWIGAFGKNTTGTSPEVDSTATVGIFCNSNNDTVYRCEIINGTRVFEPARYARFAPD